MKLKRHEKIIELIEQYDIETQDELAELLRKEGFDVTQATVSRDIRKLALSKVPGKNGRQKYALLNHQDHQMAEKYVGILREAFVSMDQAQNILVIKTVSGMAMPQPLIISDGKRLLDASPETTPSCVRSGRWRMPRP